MDKVMVTVLLIVAGIACSLVVINAVYPVITGSSSAIVDAATKIDDRIRSNISIVQMANQGNNVYIWIKNVGASRILGISASDVFFGLQNGFSRVSYGTGTNPYWDYTIENDTNWGPTATIKITIHLDSISAGTYYFKMVIPNGIIDEQYYSVL